MPSNNQSVRDYLRMIFRRKWAFVVPVLLASVVFVPLWTVTPDKFSATAVVRRTDLAVSRNSPVSLLASGQTPRIDIEAIQQEITAWNNLHDVIVQTKQDVDLQTPADWQAKYDELTKAIKVSSNTAPGRGTDLIRITVTLPNPDMAQQVANTIANGYVERSKSSQLSGAKASIDFLQNQMNSYHDLLSQTENELDDYRSKHYADLPEVKNGIRSRLLQLRIDHDTREQQLKDDQSQLEEAQKQLALVPKTVQNAVTSAQNPTVVQDQATISDLKGKLQVLLTTRTEQHPDVIAMRAKIKALQDEMAKEPARVDTQEVEGINPQYQDLLSQIALLQQKISGGKASLGQLAAAESANEAELADVVKQEKHYNDLMRNETQYNQQYDNYWAEYEKAKRMNTLQDQDYTVKEEVYSPALRPAFPDRSTLIKLAAACLFGGVGLGVALMFGLEFCDRSFRTIDDAATFLKVPVFASLTTIVPPAQAARRRRRQLVVSIILLVLLLGLLCAATAWYLKGPHNINSIIDNLHRGLRARFVR